METQVELSQRLMKLFEASSKNCDCHWPSPMFDEALKEFISVRLQIHRARKLSKHGVLVPMYLLMNRATMLRHRLEYFAPCRDCIEKYNPTGRKNKRVWNPKRKRAYKEALQ